jgi:alpha-1,2-mannosyltransferase
LLPYIVQGKIVYATSLSVPSFALRLLSHSPAFYTRHDVLEPHYMNVLSLTPEAVHRIVRGLMIAVGLAGLWWMRAPLRSLKTPRYVLEIAAVSCFMVWFSERSWVHHYISIILMFGAAGMLLSDPHRSTSSKRRIAGALWAFVLLSVLATEVGQIFGPDGIDWAHALGAYLLPSILVSAIVLCESRDTRELHSNRIGV